MASTPQREQVFVSYSHKDKKLFDQLQTFLKPLVRDKRISIWDDTKIKSGDAWREKIKTAIASAKVAVLLVSSDFLASDFIAEHELPPLLEAAQKEGLRILWIAARHSVYEETEIARYQAVNDPERPLATISGANREKELVRICREIQAAASHEMNVMTQAQAGAISARRLKIKEADWELFGELKEALPSNGSIRFIRDFVMGSASFNMRSLDDLYNFLRDWDDVEHEFLDKELEEKRSYLFTLIDEYLSLIAINTFPTKDGSMQSVPSEWVYEQNERYMRVVNELHGKAEEIVKTHQDLIRTARYKLEQ
jgi:hypothetical protein